MMRSLIVALATSLALLCYQARAQSIVDAVVETEDFSLLEAAVVQANLVPTLSGPGPFTVFAPTNSSFETLPADLLTKLLSDPWKAHLTDVLLYHVTAGNISSADLVDEQAIPMVNGENAIATVTNEGIFIDDAAVTDPDLFLSNGVVHVIDAVLTPSFLTTTIVDIATANTNTLATLVVSAGLEEALSDPEGTLTVFAPSDAAFAALPEGTLEFLESPQGAETLGAILTYHVVGSVIPSMAIPEGETYLTSLEGSELLVVNNGTSITVNDATVVVPDVLALNGIVHVIDSVLDFLPTAAPTMSPTAAPTPLPNIVDVVVASEDFAILEAAVIQADLVSVLSGDGPFTVFAPTNSSFDALPADILSKLLTDPFKEHLANVLLYHVAVGNVSSSDLVDLGISEITMANNENVTINIDETGVMVNDVMVIDPDIFLSNGIVHVVSGVLLPSFVGKTIVDVAIEEASILAELIVAAGLESAVNTTAGGFTVFAPTNAAFEALPEGTLDELMSPAGQSTLVGILTYHVVNGVIPSSAILDGTTTVTSLAMLPLTVSKDDDTGVLVNDASVVKPDLLAINGVVHMIDKVLTPPPPPEPTASPTDKPTMESMDEPTDMPSTEPPSSAVASSAAWATGLAGMILSFVLI